MWLAVAWPLSAGPAAFALGRGWIGYPAYLAAYRPLIRAERAILPFPPATPWDRYCDYCRDAGFAASD